jgi:hypothetical protein
VWVIQFINEEKKSYGFYHFENGTQQENFNFTRRFKKNSEAHGPVNNSKTLIFAKFDL